MSKKLLAVLKCTLVAVNIFFVTAGILTMYVGITAVMANNAYYLFWQPGFFYLPMVITATGVLIIIFAAIGFYGAIRENYLVTIAYVGALFLVFILQMTTCIISFSIREDRLGYLPGQLAWSMHNYRLGSNNLATEQWDLLQQDFECCGVVNANDWLAILESEDTLMVPPSCCSNVNGTVWNCSVPAAFNRGCSDLYVYFIASNFDAMGYGGIFQILLQGLIIVSVLSALFMVKYGAEGNGTMYR